MTPSTRSIDQLAIDTIRTLSMDAVQKAESGHPGAPMALAPTAYTLWQRYLRYDPSAPQWPNRDRFVLSNGHASMLLYSLLHLSGVKKADGKPAVTLDDIRNFRQIDSPCAGHPEYKHAVGVETTTGPLGQGVATSVGMAMASKWLASYFNRPGHELFDFDVYAICGDGDMMEGVAAEAASLAGHLRLSNLCWIYDNNKITIDGSTALSFTEEVGARFRACGWRVLTAGDANDVERLAAELTKFKAEEAAPTFIIVDSVIGYGAPKRAGSSKAHGEALGEDEVRGAKRAYGWPEDAHFLVPDGVRERFQEGVGKRGETAREAWDEKLVSYRRTFPELGQELDLFLAGKLPAGWDRELPSFEADPKGMATRVSSSKVLAAVAKKIPWVIGGAADLAGSTKTVVEGSGSFEADGYGGRNIHYGIREHAMAAASNGLALCGLRPFNSSFLIFTDYAKPAIRLSAVMELPVAHVYTHDSIDLGEDGPTHQPIEQLAMFRALPGISVVRPADANEVAEAWRVMMAASHEPTLLVLTRQNVPTYDRTKLAPATGLRKGAYVLAEAEGGKPDVILMASGAEVALCLDAREALKAEKIAARVVSFPSWDLFERQDDSYKTSVLPPQISARVAVEAASGIGWGHYAGNGGAILAMKTFGASAPAKVLREHFGFTVPKIVAAAKEQVKKMRGVR